MPDLLSIASARLIVLPNEKSRFVALDGPRIRPIESGSPSLHAAVPSLAGDQA